MPLAASVTSDAHQGHNDGPGTATSPPAHSALSSVVLDLSLDGDELRLEVDETCLVAANGRLMQVPKDEGSDDAHLPSLDHLAPGSDLGQDSPTNSASSASLPASIGAEGEQQRLDGFGDSSWRPIQQREREAAGQQQGLEGYPSGSVGRAQEGGAPEGREATAREAEVEGQSAEEDAHGVGSGSTRGPASFIPQPMAILPYHMSMLNDRDRTTRYRDGIRGEMC